MQKLLCVLMFGMMFGQTKLETRLYELEVSLIEDNPQLYNLNDFIEYELINPILFMQSVDNHNIGDADYVHIQFVNGNSGDRTFFWIYPDGTTSSQEHIIPKENEFQLKSSWADFSGTLNIAVTAEFPQEDTGYIEDGFDYCLHTGANLVSSPCRDEVAIESAIPSDILQNITGIITEGGAASNLGGMWVGSLNGLGGGKGYWVISDIDGCFNCTCSEN